MNSASRNSETDRHQGQEEYAEQTHIDPKRRLFSLGLLQKLNAELIARRVKEGFKLLDHTAGELDGLSAEHPYAASFLLNIAQWVDLGYRDHHLVQELVVRFTSVQRADLKLVDFVQIRMTEAFVAFASEDATTAISTLDDVLAIVDEIGQPYLTLLAHYWKGRAHRQKGEYEVATRHILEAKQLAQQLNAPKLIAVIQIHESWLLFQRGSRKEAFRKLDEAEAELKPTGHALSLGNIESARGRFVRRSGDYAKALEHFNHAIAIYAKYCPAHPNLARALVNAAYVKRLIAFDLSHRGKERRASGIEHHRYRTICEESLNLLDRAREIYAKHGHRSGMGTVLVNTGYVHLENDDLERASDEGAKAFDLGAETQDHILMARARTLQAAIENIEVEEQVGEAEDIANHANLAAQYSYDAIELAQLTQNKRLLAGAYIAPRVRKRIFRRVGDGETVRCASCRSIGLRRPGSSLEGAPGAQIAHVTCNRHRPNPQVVVGWSHG